MIRAHRRPCSPYAASEGRRSRAAFAAAVHAGMLAGALGGCGRSPGDRAEAPGRSPRADAPPTAGGHDDPALADTLASVLAEAYDFARPGLVARVMALYPTRDPVVAAAAGRVTTSRAALQMELQRFWTRVGRNMRDPRLVLGARHAVRLGPDAAAFTGTYAIPHRTPEGAPHTLAGAWTFVFRREAGRWTIVQEHLSDAPGRVAPGAAPAPDAPVGGEPVP